MDGWSDGRMVYWKSGILECWIYGDEAVGARPFRPNTATGLTPPREAV